MEETATFDPSVWLIPLLSGIVGALIGTFGGAYFLNRYQNYYKEKIRKIAIKAVEIFRTYVGKSYVDAQNEFNNKLTLSEKRAVIVALHKLGIPIEIPSSCSFNIADVCFLNKKIFSNFIEDIVSQLKNGLCDNLFFQDVEEHFSANLRLNTLRKLAQKYVNEVLAKSVLMSNGYIKHISNWDDLFTPGEKEAILVFREKVAQAKYYNLDGTPDSLKLKKLLEEIEIGLWDSYLFWDISSFQNIRNQNLMASLMANILNSNSNNERQSNISSNSKS